MSTSCCQPSCSDSRVKFPRVKGCNASSFVVFLSVFQLVLAFALLALRDAVRGQIREQPDPIFPVASAESSLVVHELREEMKRFVDEQGRLVWHHRLFCSTPLKGRRTNSQRQDNRVHVPLNVTQKLWQLADLVNPGQQRVS